MSLIKITLHGQIGKKFGKNWELDVKSVSEALNAINQLTDGQFNKFLAEKENRNAKYRVLINEEDFLSEGGSLDNEDDIQKIEKTNLIVAVNGLKSIDIIPVIEGGDSGIFTTILGALLIIVGAILLFTGAGTFLGVGLIMIGAGLLAAGITALLAKPPTFDDFREIGGAKKVSYLFNGPENVTREGGPIPVGYGRLLVGSQVIAASYVVRDSNGQVVQLNDTELPNSVGGGGKTFYIRQRAYPVKPWDPLYGVFLTLEAGYYELNTDNQSIYIYRPDPIIVLEDIEVHNLQYNAHFIGPDPIKNPYPDYYHKGKLYPFNT